MSKMGWVSEWHSDTTLAQVITLAQRHLARWVNFAPSLIFAGTKDFQ